MKKLLIILTLGLMFGQTKLETRVYELDLNNSSNEVYYIDLADITGYNLSKGFIQLLAVKDFSFNNPENIGYDYFCDDIEGMQFFWYSSQGLKAQVAKIYLENKNCRIAKSAGEGEGFTVEIAVTAEFPIEDTGYMEEDFDFCINEGLNLVSYPCENDIAINDALPSEISNNLLSIVGAGVAGQNINGTWVGSLTELESGSGYWFNSSIEACFNYECAEN